MRDDVSFGPERIDGRKKGHKEDPLVSRGDKTREAWKIPVEKYFPS